MINDYGHFPTLNLSNKHNNMKLKTILSLLENLDPETEINAIIHNKTIEFMDAETLSRHLYGEIKEDKPAEIPAYRPKIGDVVKINGVGEDWTVIRYLSASSDEVCINKFNGTSFEKTWRHISELHPTI